MLPDKYGASTLSILIPVQLNLDVVRAAESIFVGSHNGQLTTYRNLNLVLRADHRTKICLTAGDSINKFDIDFTISTKWKIGKELDKDLTDEDIGFLCHTKDGRDSFIHGRAIWPLESFPEGLWCSGTIGSISLELSNLEEIPEYAPSFKWDLSRPNILKINSIQLSVARSTQQEESIEHEEQPATKADIERAIEAWVSQQYAVPGALEQLKKAIDAVNGRVGWVWWFSIIALGLSLWRYY